MDSCDKNGAEPSQHVDVAEVLAFINKLNAAATDKAMPSNLHSSSEPLVIKGDGIVDRLFLLLVNIWELTAEYRPEDYTGGRYGSKAHTAWVYRLKQDWEELMKNLGINETVTKDRDRLTLQEYFLHSFGNPVRIDYGTGHEMQFALFLKKLYDCGVIKDDDLSDVVLRVMSSYFRLVQHLIDRYNLEPAGSKGAWGIDHFQFLPFLLGSAQLISNEAIKPQQVVNCDSVQPQIEKYIFIQTVDYIKRKIGRVSLEIASPMLYGICTSCTWQRINSGLQEMYKNDAAHLMATMDRVFTLGICAMANKVESAPMQSILGYLKATGDFEIIIFSEETILSRPITEWPIVECLIAFYSTNFPLEKAIDYVKRYKPIVLNDVERQRVFRSRLDVYRELQACHVPHPNYVVVDHEAVKQGKATFEEHYDYIVYNNVKINKPFIEKSLDADDHNNWIYYPTNTGGGCKKLFRKVQDRSSRYCADVQSVRRDGTYIYEEFMSTFGTDIKVYTVGCMFAHAEARKSPALDGKVDRNKDGKELRFPVILTAKEKVIAYRIVEHFGQAVCGFDILRTINGPYVCDINGWSFVKHSRHHMDLSQIIRIMFLLKLQLKYNITLGNVIPAHIVTSETTEALKKTFANIEQNVDRVQSQEELCSVVVVMRHADRKPKQKLKTLTSHPLILQYFSDTNEKQITLKSPEEMAKFTEINAAILEQLNEEYESEASRSDEEERNDESGRSADPRMAELSEQLALHTELQNVLNFSDEFAGINHKIQLKAKFGENGQVNKVLIVAKWGGELTHVGECQAEDLGRRFRQSLYPIDCTGLVRLHSTYRHDFKIFTSIEGRCQLTSAAFTKGMLDLEGELTPILVAMTIRDKKAQTLLDDNIEVRERNECKNRLRILMENWEDKEEVERLLEAIGEDQAKYYRRAVEDMTFRKSDMHRLNALLNDFMNSLEHEMTKWMYLYSVDEYATRVLHILQEVKSRWKTLTGKLCKGPDNQFQYTVIADIVDNLRYDLIHHHTYLGVGLDTAFEIYNLVEPLSAVLSPCEYGVTPTERLTIGVKVAGKLLQKIVHDVTLHKNTCDDSNKSLHQQRNRDKLYAKLVEQSVMEHKRYNSIPTELGSCYGENPSTERLNTESGVDEEELGMEKYLNQPTTDPLKKISVIASTSASAAAVAANSLAVDSDSVKKMSKYPNMTFIGGLRPSEMNMFTSRTHMEEVWDLVSSGADLDEPVEINSTVVSSGTKAKTRVDVSRDDPSSTSSGDDGDIVRQEFSEARNMSSRMSHRMVRSRYYVTSASILFSLLNFLKYAHYLDDNPDEAKPLVQYNTRDLHYLSHVVLRVWWSYDDNKKAVHRLEIMVSPGARDGFGQNYGILAENARSQKYKYRRHISRFNLDYVHGRVFCKHCGDAIDPEFVRAQFMENVLVKSSDKTGVRRSASTTHLPTTTVESDLLDSKVSKEWGLTVAKSDTHDTYRKGSRWYRCQRCAAEVSETPGEEMVNRTLRSSQVSSDPKELNLTMRSSSSSCEASFSPVRDITRKTMNLSIGNSAVPPYCELSRLAVINSNCDINRFEHLVNKVS
ncbi:Inositol hexakisphosphate and diphosphoinositol-pentakisphosphate kinase [Babesia sp. Xinjiang]|uniref:Inositol hexakisphosphate and diphosphoinositol-pentakisphosphate kinase n=1 Tax=Babesia sp. Xinjiang TaxID=462227 RepID=UPI000A254499|nr:Inositol hexakisphosphate and diphosphoinositol-pentakisphosphate kinase [Babesia sp. Xinjiang]ORM39455.1 Inositol hexakisphosphate and diphosphoinositol-pentakisphosphate kinase [Babesia sp. Xinjiang]